MRLLIKVLNNESELLLLIQNGDEAAFTIIFHHYRNWLYSIALKLSGSSLLAEEVVQDVFLKIWLKRGDLHHVKNFQAYLYVVVQNTMYKVLKKSAGVLTEPLEIVHEHTTNTFDVVLDNDYKSLLQQGVERLPGQQKQVYQLIRERGFNRKEVASLLGIDPETVKFHLSKAVKNLWNYCRLHLHLLLGLTFGLSSFL
ncbi:MAG TPA: sigma-70 family RNA polymerase sigma factor [Chitinophagaceae bacterium]|nr:sigma-70 family RNA polymerase sigma factor [Chitinophagaceae bacterium]